MEKKIFSKWLDGVMADNNIKATELGTMLDVSSTAVSKWRKGQVFPAMPSTIKIADIFGVEQKELIGMILEEKKERAIKNIEKSKDVMCVSKSDGIGADKYQELASRTINQWLSIDEKQDHAMLGMASEVGEVLGIYQKSYQGHEIKRDDVIDELGDLMWFIAEFCTASDIKLSCVLERNIEKLLKRYPDGFSEEKSIHREV